MQTKFGSERMINYSFLFATIIIITRLSSGMAEAACPDPISDNPSARDIIECIKGLQDALKKPSTLSIVTKSRALGQVFANTTGKTMIVIVTAFNKTRGNTMCGNVAASPDQLPTGVSGGNPTTTVQSSFIDDKFSASITFVVPAGHFYSVTTDGGSETLQFWTEVTL
jgi:hypothetical protein